MKKPLFDPVENTDKLPTARDYDNISPGDCAVIGHCYRRGDYVYSRDEHGKAFFGHGLNTAAKFVTLFCARCAATTEIQVCPVRIKKSDPLSMSAKPGIPRTKVLESNPGRPASTNSTPIYQAK
jgi:hypothetical protein